jgi:hypothetical protein
MFDFLQFCSYLQTFRLSLRFVLPSYIFFFENVVYISDIPLGFLKKPGDLVKMQIAIRTCFEK